MPRLHRFVPLALLAAVTAGTATLGTLQRPVPPGLPLGIRIALGTASQDDAVTARYVAARSAGVRATLAQRSLAIVRRDRAAFLRTVDPAEPAFFRAQERLWVRLTAVGFSSWSYQVQDADAIPPTSIDWRRYGADVYLPPLTLRFAIHGFDPAPVARPAVYTFVRRGDRWLIGSDRDADQLLVSDIHQDPWDLGPIAVARGRASLVIGSPRDVRRLSSVAAAADQAVANVTGVWPTGWTRRVVVEVVRDQRLFAGLVQSLGPDNQYVAVALPEYSSVTLFARTPQAPPAVVTSRVVVNPTYFNPQDPGNIVVLTHEITHVATASITTAGMPRWMVEGFAEYVAHQTTSTVETVSSSLLASVGLGVAPPGLPQDVDFQTATDLGRQYQLSWLACQFVALRWGQPELIELYRAMSRNQDPTTEPTAVESAFRQVLGVGTDGFVAAWAAFVLRVVPGLPSK